MRYLTGCFFITALVSCSKAVPNPLSASASSPVAFAPIPSPTVTIPVPAGPPAFALTLASFKVQLFRRDRRSPLQYVPVKLQVIETSGKSGAALRTLDVDAVGGVRDRDCTPEQMVRGAVLAPAASRDFAVTLGYCVPYAVTGVEVSEVTFLATFADDDGRLGELRGSANVTDCTLGGIPGAIDCK
jgi:hypothetical protein